jgi:3D-(3,5/4)-trihydroxycyclohexane-1,2-dione acylhydrolase (decyclizing)
LTDSADTGAVAIDMPKDVQGEVYDFPNYLFEKRVIFAPFTMECASKFYPEYSALLKLSKEITAANSKPIFIVGGGARYSGAGKIIAELAEKYGIAVCETQAGKSVVESSFKYNLGGLGVTGNAAANTVAKDANLIIAVGTRFTDFTTASKTLFSKNAKIVTINTSRFHAEKLNASAIIGDAARILQILSATIKGNIKSEKRAEWIRIIEIAKREWELEYDRLSKVEYGENFKPEVGAYTPNVFTEFEKATGGATAQTAALALVRALIAPDAIAVAAAGSLPGDMQRMWKTDVRDTYNMEYGYSTMGYEIAGAFGSKLAAPDRDVYAFCGDGSYLMLHSELVTSIQEGKKITVLLFDNGGFGCINNLQMVKGCNSLATEFRYKAEAETPFVPIDFAASAAGYGVKTYSAHNLAELKTAIEDAKLQTKSCLIDIKVFPKTMTDGYGGFWQTGLNQSPRNDTQKAALAEQNRLIK